MTDTEFYYDVDAFPAGEGGCPSAGPGFFR
jgi:hypothetical protein